MEHIEVKRRIEEYKGRIIKEYVEKIYDMSPDERIKYINDLIAFNNEYPFFNCEFRDFYRRWFHILLLMSIKTIEINELKEFYENLDNIGKKEFQTELHETINEHESGWRFDHNIDYPNLQLKPFYDMDTIDYKLEKIRDESFVKSKTNNQEYHERLINTFDERCSKKIIEEFKESITDYTLLMRDNLSNTTSERLFSLPAHMRMYAFMEMYGTARFWHFEDWYLLNNYNSRKVLRNSKKKQAKKA